jgi:hypothetical protein
MAVDKLHWDTRLEVKVGTETVSPIDQLTSTINTPIQVINSIESDNVAYVVQPQTYTFTMTIKAIGPAVAKLTGMARKRELFSVVVSERRGADWTFKSIAYHECLITSVNPGNVAPDGVPTASFNCVSLDVAAEAKA